jgi:hypothetical protein
MALEYRLQRDWVTGQYYGSVEITSDGKCEGWHLDREVDATLAHVGFEIVAQVLAAPLRKAWHDHLETPEHHHDGIAYCEECQDLLSLLPEGDQPIAIG